MGLVTVSVPSRGFNSHYIEDVKTKAGRIGRFPSPLGDSILITLATNMKSTAFLVSVPSRGFNSHYAIRAALKAEKDAEVSVPSRGFNSHYTFLDFVSKRKSFPSPLGDSILITIFESIFRKILLGGFRPLSGIQFSLRN